MLHAFLLLASLSTAPVHVALRPAAAVTANADGFVTLGSVADLTGGEAAARARLSAVVVARAPLPGDVRQLTRGDLSLKLRQAGYDPNRVAVLEGAPTSAVTVGNATPVDTAMPASPVPSPAPASSPAPPAAPTFVVKTRRRRQHPDSGRGAWHHRCRSGPRQRSRRRHHPGPPRRRDDRPLRSRRGRADRSTGALNVPSQTTRAGARPACHRLYAGRLGRRPIRCFPAAPRMSTGTTPPRCRCSRTTRPAASAIH